MVFFSSQQMLRNWDIGQGSSVGFNFQSNTVHFSRIFVFKRILEEKQFNEMLLQFRDNINSKYLLC